MAFLLQETGDLLLAEDSGQLILDRLHLIHYGSAIEHVLVGHSQNSQKIPVLLQDMHGEPATKVTSPTIVASKVGGANASLSDGTWAEVGNGLYTITLNATDTDTLGWMLVQVSHPAVVPTSTYVEVSTSPLERRQDYIRQRSVHRRVV